MNPFKTIVDAFKKKGYQPIYGIIVGIALGFAILVTFAEHQVNDRKLPAQRHFEQATSSWLDKPSTTADLARALDAQKVAEAATLRDNPGLVLYTLKDGQRTNVRIPGCSAISCAGTVMDKLNEHSVKDNFPFVSINADPSPSGVFAMKAVLGLLEPFSYLAILALGLLFLNKFMEKDGGSADTLATPPSVTFKDVVGNDEAKQALNRVKAFMQSPEQYQRIGATAPRGVLLVGPPGTGKTLLARALAGENKAKFISVDGSYFSSKFYGSGITKVRDLFKLARDNAPCVLFIDEIDGIGRRTQGADTRGAEQEGNRIINRILVELDGFSGLENVVVVAATNHENNLDEALRRPGRFDMTVRVQLPTLPERAQLFQLYLDKMRRDDNIDTAVLARMTSGMSPADIANLVNKAAASAAEQNAERVGLDHLLRAIETQQLGGEVSAVKDLLTPETRKRLAYHEAGHALVAHWLRAGVVERVTIEPRGPALGVTYVTRESEDPLYMQGEYASRLAMMLAGREAELQVLGSVSSGASDDLKRATELAVNMVGSLGFSKAFGLLSVAGVPRELLGPDVQASLLTEARSLLEQAQAQCAQVLTERRGALDALAAALLEREVVSGEPLKDLLAA
jgi:cell division protease FtsH